MNLKKILPFENYILATSLSPEEVYKRLSQNVEPRKTFRTLWSVSSSTKEFEGEIYSSSFNICRVIGYRNSFLPDITGNISVAGGQTQIHIKMQLSIFVLIFISLWLVATGFLSVMILFFELIQLKKGIHNKSSPMTLIPFGMFIFGCLLTWFGFKAESRNAKDFLAIIFKGQEIK